MSSGWIPAHRRIYDPEHWLAPTKRDPSCRRDAWLDLCQMATHQERETRNSGTLEKGELIVSLRTLARRWCWHRSKVERFVNELKTRTAIGTVRETPDGTVYRIVNYETYADLRDSERDTGRDTNRDSGETAARQEQPLNHRTINQNNGPTGDVENSIDAYHRAAEDLLGARTEQPSGNLTISGLVELANSMLGLDRLPPEDRRRNQRIVTDWNGQGRRLEDIQACIVGLAALIRDGKVWIKPNEPATLATLYKNTLYDQGDGKAKRPLWDVAYEYYQRQGSTEPTGKRGGGLKGVTIHLDKSA